MPEGDSVWRLSERLQPLVGREIAHSQFRVPQLATVDLSGKEILRVWPHGKHLFWLVGDLVLHTHLRMDGLWRIHQEGTRWSLPAHTARLVVRVSGGIELVGHDLGIVELWPAREFDARMGWLGPDLLADDWDTAGRWAPSGREEALRRVGSEPSRTIGEALLDQRNLAGIGNEYRAEVCFLSGVHPASRVAEVDVAAVVDLTVKLMRANLSSPVRTFTGDQRRGSTTFVFGRAGRPCLRCGAAIAKDTLGGGTSVADPDAGRERIIWSCPRCQPVAG
ncbi:endonuclease-8 [Tessaracoccus bendigoensis DSM 12906]|uniref:DNA-(apurinic or apyrimidinic site) lyase n=1 Tax=Tessaracoccus bendigoensis DSM 12906 TaxID=1123357 RepID=A0A1M6DEI6_9ACTN|nr:DNA-formamidopyrimidine glycosylase family protein [Tessaracoccus bendigoensis]SHI71623.1 endonuclease-8 [Tessaracoccus bendigoensis DSM 12906]